MKCPLFQCHSSYYYDNANLDLSDDEAFDKFLYEKKKKGDLYFLYEKAITKVVIETKQNYHIPSDHEKIEREEIKNVSEMDSEEWDDINLFLKKNDCENMFSKKKKKEIKQVKLPSTYNKNRICSIRKIDVEMEKKADASITDEKNIKINRKKDLLICDDIESELKEEKNKRNGNEIIENFKDNLCNGLKNYFSGIFQNVTKQKKGEDKKKNIENLCISNLNSSEDDGLSDYIFSSENINSISLDFENISPFSSFKEKVKNEEKQEKLEFHASIDSEEHNLAVLNRKRKNGVYEKEEQEQEQEQKQKRKRKKIECSFENLSDFSSFTDHSINTIVDKYEKGDEEEKRHLTNNPFSSFYTKSTSCNLSKKKRYNSNNNNNNNNKRKKNINAYNTDSDQKRKTLNKNADFHITKSNKKMKGRIHMESQKKCIFARDFQKLVNDKWTEKGNVGNRKKMGVVSWGKHKISSYEFNKKIDNIVKDNEVFNQRNYSQNKKLQNLSNNENNEDFTFVHFQKNVNSNILNKFLL